MAFSGSKSKPNLARNLNAEASTGQLTAQRRMFLDPRLRTEHRTVCRHLRGAVLSPIERGASA